MERIATGFLVVLLCAAPAAAQERDPSLIRISLALEQPTAVKTDLERPESRFPKTFGIFTLVAPIKRGELIRVSIPIGEITSRAFRGVAAANRRRQEGAARRKVAAELRALAPPSGGPPASAPTPK